ncbi:hypothetical protein [Chryseolinea lacunae]|uniref:DUF4421 domain-containing protein n=1 Tax=Chryseolinea lacunae TaxID=2801331 RepID=A0ABS1KR71_9BACT|nr:hypothetical protein [Chryseolinea lacunae]MBL0741970.1 hypothetical protein [Chryseolinea lacunae]
MSAKSFSFFFTLLLVGHFAMGQVDTLENSVEHQKFLTMVNANREQSYITFGSGLGNLEPLIFESRLSPSYFFTGQKRSWALVLNPQVQIRMLDRKSMPIRNPSYKVYVTYYHDIKFWQTSFLKKLFYRNALWYASVAHHSNGQDGSFYSPDTTRNVNLENGNFATNFLEIGVSSYHLEKLGKNNFSIREIKAWLEWHPPGWSINEMNDNYGYYRLYAKAGFIGPMRKRKDDAVNRWLQQSSLELKAGWIMGQMNGASPLDMSHRLVIDITYKYYPKWFDEVAFFMRFYRGQDYYNIYYLNGELTQLSAGITSNIMNFKKAVKYLK